MIVHPYLRVSTNEQADSRLGLDAQRAAIMAACSARTYDLGQWHEDAGLTGSNARRPALQKLMSDIAPGEAIIVAKLCRLSRSIGDFAGMIARAEREGWAIVCLDPEVDLQTPNGRLVASIIVAVSRWEAEIIGQRTKDALAAKTARGERLGRAPTIGDELAAEIVAMRSTMTLQEIANDLNRRQVPTPAGGAMWRPSSLQGLIARERASS